MAVYVIYQISWFWFNTDGNVCDISNQLVLI